MQVNWIVTEMCLPFNTFQRLKGRLKSHFSHNSAKTETWFFSCDVHALFWSRVIIDLEDKLPILNEVFIFSIHLTSKSIWKLFIYLVFSWWFDLILVICLTKCFVNYPIFVVQAFFWMLLVLQYMDYM